jgi:hypothetical protein
MRGGFELKLSLMVIIFLTAVYAIYEALSIPAGGHPFGHSLGILGAILMVMTETVYSARKRWGIFKFGQVRHWLSFHIFTGIIGPFLVLMHTGLAFRGLAGLAMFLTLLVVGSGFLGRYIYTAVPRSLAGIEVDRRTLEQQAGERQRALEHWAADKSSRVQQLVGKELAQTRNYRELSLVEILTRRLHEYRERRRLRKAIRALDREERERMAEINQLLRQQRRLQRQISSLRSVRRLMGWWHTFHVPLGLTLFAAIFIHILATIYYGGI